MPDVRTAIIDGHWHNIALAGWVVPGTDRLFTDVIDAEAAAMLTGNPVEAVFNVERTPQGDLAADDIGTSEADRKPHEEIIARLEGLTEASDDWRQSEIEIAVLLGWEFSNRYSHWVPPARLRNHYGPVADPPFVTRKFTAAYLLLKAAVPGWIWADSTYEDPTYTVKLVSNSATVVGRGSSRMIAMCAAIVMAHQAEQTS